MKYEYLNQNINILFDVTSSSSATPRMGAWRLLYRSPEYDYDSSRGDWMRCHESDPRVMNVTPVVSVVGSITYHTHHNSFEDLKKKLTNKCQNYPNNSTSHA